MSTRCAIYTRVSTQEQGREGASLPKQLQDCRHHAARQGWTVVDELQDVQSGLDPDRTAYLRVFELARARAIDVVLVWRLDRFGRDDAEALVRLKELAHLQARVVSATEGEQNAFLQKLMFLLANEESRRTGERVRPVMRKKAEEGLWMATPPFGYRMDPVHKGRLVVHEHEAAVVRELFRRYAGGESLNRLHLWLNGATTVDGTPPRPPRGTFFSRMFAAYVLRNPVYVGMLRYNLSRRSKFDGRRLLPADERLVVPGQHEPLIDRETFDRAQALLEAGALRKRPQRQRHVFLLTGLLTCGLCGRAMCGNHNHRRGGYHYRCGNHAHPRIGGKALDAAVLGQIAALPVPAPEDLRRALPRDEQPDRGADLQAQRKRHEERRKRLTLFLADGTLTPEDYRAAIGEMDAAMGALDRELAALPPRQDADALIAQAERWLAALHGMPVAAVLDAASFEERAALTNAAVREVVAIKGQKPAIRWHPWAEALRHAGTLSA